MITTIMYVFQQMKAGRDLNMAQFAMECGVSRQRIEQIISSMEEAGVSDWPRHVNTCVCGERYEHSETNTKGKWTSDLEKAGWKYLIILGQSKSCWYCPICIGKREEEKKRLKIEKYLNGSNKLSVVRSKLLAHMQAGGEYRPMKLAREWETHPVYMTLAKKCLMDIGYWNPEWHK